MVDLLVEKATFELVDAVIPTEAEKPELPEIIEESAVVESASEEVPAQA